jgi:large subunit ribosomal protein L22
MATTFQASHRYAKTTARKARLVADLIRGLPVNRALAVLDRSPRRAAVLLGKVVRSAVANAEQDAHVDTNRLVVAEARVDEGPLLGGFLRWRPGARGRAMPIRKRTSHIRVRLGPAATGRAQATQAAGDASDTAPEAPADAPARKTGGRGKQAGGKAGAKGSKATDAAKGGKSGGKAGGKAGGARRPGRQDDSGKAGKDD